MKEKFNLNEKIGKVSVKKISGLFFFSLILTLFLINSVNAVWNSSLNNGLVAYYNLNNTIEDIYNGYNFTDVSTSAYTTGKIDDGYYVDGTNGLIDDSNVLKLKGDFTLSFWIKQLIETPTSDYYPVFMNLDYWNGASESGGGLLFDGNDWSDGTFSFAGIQYPDWHNVFIKGRELSLTEFEYITLMRNSTGIYFYINNTLQGKNESIYSQTDYTNSNKATFGTFSDKTNQFVIDEIGFWNVTLSAEQISALYNSGVGISFPSEEEIPTNISQITNCTDLQNMNNNLTADYFLMNNIDCSDTINWNTNEGFVPIAEYYVTSVGFTGTFDGQGYNITDLYINRANDFQALFSYANGEIKNVGLINVNITGNTYCAGLLGYLEGGTISNSFTTGNVVCSGMAGGLIANNFGTINNSYVDINILGGIQDNPAHPVGALIGYNNVGGLIENSYATGNVTGFIGVGGLVGTNDANINSSYSTANVIQTGTGFWFGGLVGMTRGTIDNSYATGSVTGDGELYGGLVGYSEGGIIENSNATGSVTSTGGYVGGLIGNIYDGTITNTFATGNVEAGYSVGGLIGEITNTGTIDNSYATGNITSIGQNLGGLVGENQGTIINSNATGNLIGITNVGGLVGKNGGTIINSHATGIINGTTWNIGGLVGYNEGGTIQNTYATGNVYCVDCFNSVAGLIGTGYQGIINSSYATGNIYGGEYYTGGLIGDTDNYVENCYATGNVTGDNSVGGLMGYMYSTTIINNSYSTGNVVGNSDVGGLVGYNGDGGTCINSYWNKYLSGQNTSACGDVLNNINLLKQTSYVDWDFTNIWDIQTNTTPYLRFNPEPIFYNNLPLEEEAISISSVSYETPITLNGGTTKEINILFDTSSELVDDTSAQVIITNGLESRTSNSCVNISTEFNCSITMQFYDSAGSWNINASIEDNEANLIENSTESFIVNELNYVTQDFNYVNWGSLIPNTNDNEADNTITITNGGNQDYPTCNLKAYDLIGDIYFDIINASQFNIDNIGSATTGQIYLQNDTNIDISSKINLNGHNSSATSQIFFYTDVPLGLKGDTYHQLNSWEISLS